jgi:hypothetical protein
MIHSSSKDELGTNIDISTDPSQNRKQKTAKRQRILRDSLDFWSTSYIINQLRSTHSHQVSLTIPSAASHSRYFSRISKFPEREQIAQTRYRDSGGTLHTYIFLIRDIPSHHWTEKRTGYWETDT